MRMRKLSLLGVLLLSVALLACRALQKPPKHDCPIKSLVLDETVFPPGSHASFLESPLPYAAWASAGRTIYLPRGIANHDVYQHKTPKLAAEDFLANKKARFAEDEHTGPWSTPSEVSYRSPIADQYYVACGNEWGAQLCIMVAQYEEYYVLVTAHISEDGMTYADLEKVLRAVDEKMSHCLGKSLSSTPTPTAAR